jgi:putative peptidoglycan lipid II flippase
VVWALGIGAVLVMLLLIGALSDGPAPAAPSTPPSATPFDPLGTSGRNGAENDHLAPLAVDGDATTAWQTEPYRRAGLGGLKEGVGLILDLDGTRTVRGIELATSSDDWRIEVYVADGFGPNDATFDAEQLGEPVAVLKGSGTVEESWDPVQGSELLLWITETGLPQIEDPNRFRLVVNEIRLR